MELLIAPESKVIVEDDAGRSKPVLARSLRRHDLFFYNNRYYIACRAAGHVASMVEVEVWTLTHAQRNQLVMKKGRWGMEFFNPNISTSRVFVPFYVFKSWDRLSDMP